MEIFTGNIRLILYNELYPTDIELFSIIPDTSITFKYNINNNIKYINYLNNNKIYQHILYEILNKSLLWDIKYNIKYIDNELYDIEFKVLLIMEYIDVYIDSSLAFNYYIYDLFNNISNFTDDNNSIVPNIDLENYIQYNCPDFKINLYNYQNNSLIKMINIEKNINHMKINYEYNLIFNNKNILFDPVKNIKTNTELFFDIKTKGGILADEMGLGKTISMIALMHYNPAPNNIEFIKNNKINTKATLIICPSHLVKQWETEIKKCNPKLKILTILTKPSHIHLKFKDFIDADILITSHQFITNLKYYPTIYYYNTVNSSRINLLHRLNTLTVILDNLINEIGFPNIYNLEQPLFEFFNFHRLIIDEGHEIFGELMVSNVINKYIANWILNISSNFNWYISGTPFPNLLSIKNCAKFLDIKLFDKKRNLDYSYNDESLQSNKLLSSFINKKYIFNNILNKICIRHKYNDIKDQIKLYGFEENIIWLTLTNLERQLYDSKKCKVSSTYLQQLCCHPLIIESSKKIFGEVEVDLLLMQDKLIDFHKNNYEKYKIKLENLDNTKPEFYILKKKYELQINESNFLFNIFENMKLKSNIIENESCVICMDELINPTITICGHIYCFDCIKQCVINKKFCPLCKKELLLKDIMIINKNNDNNNENNEYINKYGSKLGKLISLIINLKNNDNTRIIIFSQWDDMLSLIGKTLTDNNIINNFVKGNVWSRNNSINKFKNSKEDSVIMLSLKNAASGTNLIEATHIIFVEPINAPLEEIKSIESQAIARACRIGQKQKVKIIRLLLKDTIEEEIYSKYNQ